MHTRSHTRAHWPSECTNMHGHAPLQRGSCQRRGRVAHGRGHATRVLCARTCVQNVLMGHQCCMATTRSSNLVLTHFRIPPHPLPHPQPCCSHSPRSLSGLLPQRSQQSFRHSWCGRRTWHQRRRFRQIRCPNTTRVSAEPRVSGIHTRAVHAAPHCASHALSPTIACLASRAWRS
jgi:hypothetical protein